jgi:hypothetical protein
MLLGQRRLRTTWPVGDGREEALAPYVTRHARAGDVDDVIRAIDRFCVERTFLINVGEEGGGEGRDPCGWSGPCLPTPGSTRSSSARRTRGSPRRILEHAGAGDRVTVVVGTLGDGGPAQVDHHPAGLEQLLEATHGTVKFLGNELMVEGFYAVSPDAAQACWATSAPMGPAPALAILQAAAATTSRRSAGSAPTSPGPANRCSGSCPIRPRSPRTTSSWRRSAWRRPDTAFPGPIRPPYAEMPASFDEASRECGRRWRELCARITAQPAGAGCTP